MNWNPNATDALKDIWIPFDASEVFCKTDSKLFFSGRFGLL